MEKTNLLPYQREESQQSSLPPLVKQSAIYKLIVPRKVEEKIRYLCRKFPRDEWSGVLFYRHSGSFEAGDLLITCEDFFPMDLGSATFTQFRMDESVVGYIAENIDLFDCDMGLCHSHNQMSSFFSGTDTSTLRSEGNDSNCFVSLIVNNKGEYCAAITRKVCKVTEMAVRNMGEIYEFFGEGTYRTEADEEPVTEMKQETVIEYFMLAVEREVVANPYDSLDRRFDEIESRKQQVVKAPLAPVPSVVRGREDYSFQDWRDLHTLDIGNQSVIEPEEPALFSEEEMGEIDVTKWQPNPQYIHDAVVKMLLCSLTIKTEGIDLKQWITRHMEKMYGRIFDASMTPDPFADWCDFIIPFTMDNFSDESTPGELYEDPDLHHSIVAGAVLEELSSYPGNEYIESYCDYLKLYIIN